jgi:hypothetical protein
MDYTKCWYNSITLATSTDQGASYTHTSPPSHRVATVPYQYVADTGPYGVFEPSNTIYTQRPGDSQPYYYTMVRVEDYPKDSPVQQNGACVMRTQNLSDPTSWRTWNGTSFSVRFIDPYLEPGADPSQHVCKPVSRPQIVKMSYNVTYSNHFGKYLLVAPAGKIDPTSGAAVWGFYYSTSTDLVNWSTRQLRWKRRFPGPARPATRTRSTIRPCSIQRARRETSRPLGSERICTSRASTTRAVSSRGPTAIRSGSRSSSREARPPPPSRP